MYTLTSQESFLSADPHYQAVHSYRNASYHISNVCWDSLHGPLCERARARTIRILRDFSPPTESRDKCSAPHQNHLMVIKCASPGFNYFPSDRVHGSPSCTRRGSKSRNNKLHVMEVAYTVCFPSVTTTVRNFEGFSRPTRSPVSLWNPPEEHASLQTPPCAYSDSRLKRGGFKIPWLV